MVDVSIRRNKMINKEGSNHCCKLEKNEFFGCSARYNLKALNQIDFNPKVPYKRESFQPVGSFVASMTLFLPLQRE